MQAEIAAIADAAALPAIVIALSPAHARGSLARLDGGRARLVAVTGAVARPGIAPLRRRTEGAGEVLILPYLGERHGEGTERISEILAHVDHERVVGERHQPPWRKRR